MDKVNNAAEAANAKITSNEDLSELDQCLSPGYTVPFFGCCSDWIGCCIIWWLPCCTMSETRVRLDGRESTWWDVFCCPNSYVTRQSLRHKYNLGSHPTCDAVTWCLCPWCVLHQDARELAKQTGSENRWFLTPGGNL